MLRIGQLRTDPLTHAFSQMCYQSLLSSSCGVFFFFLRVAPSSADKRQRLMSNENDTPVITKRGPPPNWGPELVSSDPIGTYGAGELRKATGYRSERNSQRKFSFRAFEHYVIAQQHQQPQEAKVYRYGVHEAITRLYALSQLAPAVLRTAPFAASSPGTFSTTPTGTPPYVVHSRHATPFPFWELDDTLLKSRLSSPVPCSSHRLLIAPREPSSSRGALDVACACVCRCLRRTGVVKTSAFHGCEPMQHILRPSTLLCILTTTPPILLSLPCKPLQIFF